MNPNRKTNLRAAVLGILLLTVLLFSSGCENAQIGVGFSGYDSSTGMSYHSYSSTGPYGNYGGSSVGYSGSYGRGYYGRPYGW